HHRQVLDEAREAAGHARLAVVRVRARAVQRDFDDVRIDFIAQPPRELAAERMAVRLHAHDEAEAAGERADAEKIGMRERLTAAQNHVEHVHVREIAEERRVLVEGERRAAQIEIVVAEEAVEIAAVGELDQHAEEMVLFPAARVHLIEGRHDGAAIPASTSCSAKRITSCSMTSGAASNSSLSSAAHSRSVRVPSASSMSRVPTSLMTTASAAF